MGHDWTGAFFKIQLMVVAVSWVQISTLALSVVLVMLRAVLHGSRQLTWEYSWNFQDLWNHSLSDDSQASTGRISVWVILTVPNKFSRVCWTRTFQKFLFMEEAPLWVKFDTSTVV